MSKSNLRTLKDFGNQCNCGSCEECLIKKELKQEAIKWVKHYEKLEETEYNVDCSFINQWITEFFNITEDDLK